MDKRGQPFTLRLPLALETKIKDRARRSGRSFSKQLVIDLARGIHVDSFDVEEFCTTLPESEEKNGSGE
jgi:hypothetical protein